MVNTFIVIAILALFFWKDVAKLVGLDKIAGGKVSSVLFAILAYGSVMLLMYRIFPNYWYSWYNGGWFTISQALIFVGAIGIGLKRTLSGLVILAVGLALAGYDIYINYNNVLIKWDMKVSESKTFTMREYEKIDITQHQYDVYMITAHGDTLIKEPQKQERFIYQSGASSDNMHGGSGEWRLYSKKPQHVEFKLHF